MIIAQEKKKLNNKKFQLYNTLFEIGIPLFYLELAVGQRMRKAAISCWNLVSPFAAGIGIASAAVSFVIGLYYNTMVAWTLLYLWGSLIHQDPLPYSVCPPHSYSHTSEASVFLKNNINNKTIANEPLKSSAELECQVSERKEKKRNSFISLKLLTLIELSAYLFSKKRQLFYVHSSLFRCPNYLKQSEKRKLFLLIISLETQ